MASINVIQLKFHIGMVSRRVVLQMLKNDCYALPSGDEVFIAKPVLRLLKSIGMDRGCSLEQQNFNTIIDCIDTSGSDRPMVPIRRIGAGPTEKSARFSVLVIQKVKDRDEGPVKEKNLAFTLPVSQVEMVGDNLMVAPLWLILEKLKDKADSKWGAKTRSENSVVSEFVPATLRATTSPRVLVLKAWLTTMRNELAQEVANTKNAADVLQSENERVAEEVFQNYLSDDSTPWQKLKTALFVKHGIAAANLFLAKVSKHKSVLNEKSPMQPR